MSKQNLKRFPSLKNNLLNGSIPDRRQSRENGKTPESSELRTISNQEIQIAKKIQNKIRMRKRTSNAANNVNNQSQEGLQDCSSGFGSVKNLQCSEGQENRMVSQNQDYFDQGINLNELIEKVWDHDANLIEKTMNPLINRNHLKELIMEESNIIICQLGRGKKIEDVLVEKGEKIIRFQINKRRIQEKQKKIMSMIDRRIEKLCQV